MVKVSKTHTYCQEKKIHIVKSIVYFVMSMQCIIDTFMIVYNF